MARQGCAPLVVGAWVKPETYAIDWIQADGQGRVCSRDCSRNDLWLSFGAPLLAVANGTVVRASDGAPDIPPRVDANPQTREEFGGNSVIVQIGPRAFAFYGHLVNGSVAVKVGDHVKTGQVGKLGNSGNTSAPHLHFDLLEGPDVLLDRSIPYEVDRFELAGSGTENEDLTLTVTGPGPAFGPSPPADPLGLDLPLNRSAAGPSRSPMRTRTVAFLFSIGPAAGQSAQPSRYWVTDRRPTWGEREGPR